MNWLACFPAGDIARHHGKYPHGKREDAMLRVRGFLHYFCRFGSISAFQKSL
jgi:hypothetical protein